MSETSVLQFYRSGLKPHLENLSWFFAEAVVDTLENLLLNWVEIFDR